MQQPVLILLLIHFSLFVNAQTLTTSDWGVRLGVHYQFGTIVNRVGCFSKAYFSYRDVQFNVALRWQFNMSNYGPPKSGQEFVLKGGAAWAWGQATDLNALRWTSAGHQSNKRHHIGYSFNHYWDQIGTNQSTGTLQLQLHRWAFTIENDAFAGPPADKFRTAAARLSYQPNPQILIAIASTLWTGDPFTNFIDTQVSNSGYPSRFGYRDMRNANYGKYSHGILNMLVQYQPPLEASITGLNHHWHFEPSLRLATGIDSEWVRHILQNIIIHDLPFIPARFNPAKHPHIPMVCEDGSQYLFLPFQRVKPASTFVQWGCNESVFY